MIPVFERSAIYAFTSFRLRGNGDPQALRAARVETTFFPLLGVQPLVGRALEPGDEQPERAHVVVLSHSFWTTRFGGDPSIIGRAIDLDREPHTVVGVMPRTFGLPEWAMLWTPLVWTPTERAVRGEHHYLAIARLKAGVSVERARSELKTIARRLADEYPADNAGWGAKVVPLSEETVGEFAGLALVLAAVGIYSVLAYTVRQRVREIGIRMALGAEAGDVVRSVVADGLRPTLAGIGIGIAVAMALGRIVNGLIYGVRATDLATLVTMSALLSAVALSASMLPAYRATHLDPIQTLRDE